MDFKEIDRSESVGPSANRTVISDHDIGTETVLVTNAHNPWKVKLRNRFDLTIKIKQI